MFLFRLCLSRIVNLLDNTMIKKYESMMTSVLMMEYWKKKPKNVIELPTDTYDTITGFADEMIQVYY